LVHPRMTIYIYIYTLRPKLMCTEQLDILFYTEKAIHYSRDLFTLGKRLSFIDDSHLDQSTDLQDTEGVRVGVFNV